MDTANLRLINTLGLLGISFVLLIGFVIQFIWHELPCPLCLLQRVGFGFVAVGFLFNVVQGPRPANYGVVLFGALFGAACALRQICLHVVPGTGHYGSPIFGIHFYTWAFILFTATILAVAVLLAMTNHKDEVKEVPLTGFYLLACWLGLIAVGANVIMTFVECGIMECPGDPIEYWMFSPDYKPG